MIYVDTRDEIKRVMHSKKGFTIVELVVVVVVIGILAAITIVSYGAITRTAQSRIVAAEVQRMGAELKKVKADTGAYPVSLEGIAQSNDFTYQYTSGNNGVYCLSAAQKAAAFYVKADNAEPRAGGCSSAAAGGLSHTIVAKGDKLYAWGRNNYGQLGDGTTVDKVLPVTVNLPGVAIAIDTGYNHSVAVTSDGLVYSWGVGTNGQIGNGAKISRPAPTSADVSGVLSGKKVTTVAAGGSHTIAITSDGGLYAWGRNANGQLGSGSTAESAVPVAVDTSDVLAGKKIIAIDAGYLHSIALASDGTVYTWGENADGQLGNNSTVASSKPVAVDTTGVLAGKRIRAVAAGYYHSVALASDGKVYTWGRNSSGQLGIGATSLYSSTPVATISTGALSNATISSISAGGYFTGALAMDGRTAYAWGNNTYGQFGSGTNTSSSSPVKVDNGGALAGRHIEFYMLGDYQSIAVGSDGAVYTWGYNPYGQLGTGDTANQSLPQLVNIPN